MHHGQRYNMVCFREMDYYEMKREYWKKKDAVADKLLKMCEENFFSNEEVDLVRTMDGFRIINSVTHALVTVIDEDFIDTLLENDIIINNEEEEQD